MKGQRGIFSRKGSQELGDALQSLLSVELMSPSPIIWLISPYITDFHVLDNVAGQFTTIEPEWDQTRLRLSSILRTLAKRGSEIRLITSVATASRDFLTRMEAHREEFPEKIKIDVSDEQLHEKGMLTERFHLAGSFNFTYSGVRVRRERAFLTTVKSDLAKAAIEFQDEWRRRNGSPA